MRTYVHVNTCSPYTPTHPPTHIHKYMRAHTSTHTRTHAHTHKRTHTQIQTCTDADTHMDTRTQVLEQDAAAGITPSAAPFEEWEQALAGWWDMLRAEERGVKQVVKEQQQQQQQQQQEGKQQVKQEDKQQLQAKVVEQQLLPAQVEPAGVCEGATRVGGC